MWSDNEADFDLLDVRHLVAAVTSTVSDPRLLPVTLGVYGAWGSGKSSVINMSRTELEQDPKVLCVSFNGWQFEGYEDAKAALMGTVLDAIISRRSVPEQALQLGKKLLKRVDWFRLLGWAGKSVVTLTTGLPAFGVGALVDAAATALPKKIEGLDVDEARKLLKEAPDGEDAIRRPVREFRDDFATLVKKSGLKRVVVFIDDLDRCNPPTVIETLEAIKLFLFVEGTAFVIGADEDLVRHAVRERFPEIRGSAVDVSTSYLEKLIQVPLRVPPLGRAEMETYMNLLFIELHIGTAKMRTLRTNLTDKTSSAIGTVSFSYDSIRNSLETDVPVLSDDLAMVSQIADILTAGLKGNPRQTKRFLNALLLRMRMAEARGVSLRRRVLAKLMLLEYLHTQAFIQVGDWQAANQGIATPLNELELTTRAGPRSDYGQSDPIRVETPFLVGQQASRPVGGGVPRPSELETQLPDDTAKWPEHPWLRRWLALDPALGTVDLRPYYFFARDRVTVSERAIGRMTPEARRVLGELQSESDLRRAAGLKQVASVSDADAAAIFEILTEQVRRAEDLRGTRSVLATLFDLAGARPELIAEAVRVASALEDSRLGGGVPPAIFALVRNTPSESVGKQLLTRWSKSKNEGLRVASEAALAARTRNAGRPAK